MTNDINDKRKRKTARQRELRRLNPERYRRYDKTKERIFSKEVDCLKRKIRAMKLVKPLGIFFCAICHNEDLVHLTIDHIDESGSERNLYYKLITGKSSPKNKQILCYSCNSALRVLGHNNTDKAFRYLRRQNEARKRSIQSGIIKGHEISELVDEEIMRLAGLFSEKKIGSQNESFPDLKTTREKQ